MLGNDPAPTLTPTNNLSFKAKSPINAIDILLENDSLREAYNLSSSSSSLSKEGNEMDLLEWASNGSFFKNLLMKNSVLSATEAIWAEKALLALAESTEWTKFSVSIICKSNSSLSKIVSDWAISRIIDVERDPNTASYPRLLNIIYYYYYKEENNVHLREDILAEKLVEIVCSQYNFEINFLALRLVSFLLDQNPGIYLTALRSCSKLDSFIKYLIRGLAKLEDPQELSTVLLYLLLLFQLVDDPKLQKKLFHPKNINQSLLMIIYCFGSRAPVVNDGFANQRLDSTVDCAYQLLLKILRNPTLHEILVGEEARNIQEIISVLKVSDSSHAKEVLLVMEVYSTLILEGFDASLLAEYVESVFGAGLVTWLNHDYTSPMVISFLTICQDKAIPFPWKTYIPDLIALVCDTSMLIGYISASPVWPLEQLIELLYQLTPNGNSAYYPKMAKSLQETILSTINDYKTQSQSSITSSPKTLVRLVFNYIRALWLLSGNDSSDLFEIIQELKGQTWNHEFALPELFDQMIITQRISPTLYERIKDHFSKAKCPIPQSDLYQSLCKFVPHLRSFLESTDSYLLERGLESLNLGKGTQ